jgi:hypothetical protein
MQGAPFPPPSVAMPFAPMQFAPPLPYPPPKMAGNAIPCFHKLSFPTFNGKEDPLDWLKKCEQFFYDQQTRHGDRVWLASYHLTGTTL